MAAVQTFVLPHLPSHPIHAALFTSVSNAAFLRQQLLDGNSEFEYAFIDASLIISTSHFLAATSRAINDSINNRLKSRNVHSEIVFSLNPNNNIADSFRHFGISNTTTSLLAIKVSIPPPPSSSPSSQQITLQSVTAHLTASIQGHPTPLTDASIASLTDWAKVIKVYKLSLEFGGLVSSGGGGKKGGKKGAVADVTAGASVDEQEKEKEAVKEEVLVVVLGIMALRGS